MVVGYNTHLKKEVVFHNSFNKNNINGMIKFKSDEKGTYAQWGTLGKKFYYPCGSMTKKDKAKMKALVQGIASIISSKEVK